MPKRGLVVPIALLSLFFSLFTVQSFADSQARIVRLSTVDGAVQIDRAIGSGFEKAMANLPITQGTKLRSRGEGRAEIEFEDRSTVRMADDALVGFPQLVLRDSGARATTIEVERGTAYVNFGAKQNDEFAVIFGRQTIHLMQPVHFRLEMKDGTAVLAVFKGELSVEGPEGSVNVGRKQSLSFDMANPGDHKLSKNVEPAPFDDWDKHLDQYHDAYLARNSSSSLSPYAYGMSDLNYYGSFFNAAGYGTVWQPFFTDASWSPFNDGAWAWYPGAGYMWISAYPWGWTPYRYGSWMFLGGYGWVWQPGNFNSWGTMPLVVNAPQRFVTPRPPVVSGNVHNTFVVNRGTGVIPSASASNKLIVRTNSAGLGIPRGSLKNPAQVSQQVAQKGSATVHVQPTAPPPMQPGMYPGMSSRGMASPGMSSPGGASSGSPRGSASPSMGPRGGAPSGPSPSMGPRGGSSPRR